MVHRSSRVDGSVGLDEVLDQAATVLGG